MGSKGGHSQTQHETGQTNPWGPAQPYLTDAMARAQKAYSAPPSYWGGPLTVGPTTAENAAWKDLNTYNSGYFGPGGEFGKATGANDYLLAGGASAGNARSIAPGAVSGINELGGMGQYQLGQLGTAGSLDATSAIKTMLSGTPDYTGLQGSIDAANNPLMRDFNNRILPGLNSQATFSNNSTGGIKSLGTIVPDLGARMSENALALTSGERARALAAQQYASGLVTQGGLTQDSQGLQARGEYANEKLGIGQLLGQYTGQANQASEAGVNNAPSLYSLGQQPADAAAAYAAWDRNLKTNQLTAEQAKFNYLRDQPKVDATNYAATVAPFAHVGGTTDGTSSTSGHNSFGVGDALQTGLGLYNAFGGGGLGSFGGAASGLGAAADAAGAAGIGPVSSVAGNVAAAGDLGAAAGAGANYGSAMAGTGFGAGGIPGMGAGSGASAFGMGAAAPGAAVGAPATAYLGGFGGVGGAGAGAAGGSGLLPGSIAGANMADTAAFNPSIIEATSGSGAGSGLSAAAGMGIGAGAMVGLAVFANYMDKHHSMSPQDYIKQWGGQSAAAMELAAAAHQAGDVAKEKQYLALAETTKALSGMTQDGLNGIDRGAGAYITTNRNPGALRGARQF